MAAVLFLKSRLHAVIVIAYALVIGFSWQASAIGQTVSTWTNTSASSAGWQTSSNWNNGAPSGVGASASIIADITAPQTITLDGAVVLGSMTIGDPTASGASSYTINAGTYTSGSSTLGGTLTFDVTNGSAALSQTTTSAANLIAAAVALADPLTITNSAAAAALTLSGTVSGAGAITKTGTGTLVLTGANTFSGGVTLSTGTIRVGNNAALGTGTATLGQSTALTANSTASRTLANPLSLSGSFTLGDATTSGVLNFTGAGTLTGNAQITNASYVSMSGAIGDGGNTRSLTKAGAGTLVLSGNNSYTGGTTISGGSLELGANERLANFGNVTLTSGTLDLGGFTETVNAFSATAAASVTAGTLNATGGYSFSNSTGTVTVNAALGGGGAALTKSGSGTVLFTGASTYSGGATISAGAVQAGNNAALGTGLITLTGASLASDSSTARTLANALTMGGTVTLGAASTGALTFSNAAPASLADNTTLTNVIGITFSSGLTGSAGRTLTKAGAGTLTLNGPSSVAGGITINAGGITVGAGGSLESDVTVNGGGTLTNGVASGITGNVSLVNNATFTVSNPTTMGTLTMSGTGGTVGGTGGLTSSAVAVSITAGGTGTISATLAGSGTLTKSGAGAAVISGANAGYAGPITLSEGLMVFGSANALGTGTLSLVSGTLSANSTTGRALSNALVSFDGDVTLGDATNTGVPTFSGSGALTGDRLLTFASDATITGGIAGAGYGFTKAGAGTFTINGASTYSGTTNVNAGTLVLGAASSGKTGVTNVNGGTLRLGNDSALGGAAGDVLVLTSGAVMSNSSAARGIANAVTVDGPITVGAGVTYTGAVTFSGSMTLTGNRTLSTSAATTISGNIDDLGGGYRLTKSGGSTLTLSGSNSYTGGTTISNGQLTFSSSNALGSGTVSIDGGTLVASGPYSNVTNWLGSGRIAASPNGGIAITGNSSEAINLSAYPNLSLGASASATYSGVLTPYESTGTKIYRLGGGAGTLTFSPVIADGTNPTQVLVRGDTSGGVVRLGSSNTYTGGLYLDSGTLDVNADAQLASITGSGSNAVTFTGGYLRYTTITTDFSSKFAMPTAGNQIGINTNGLTVSFANTLTGSGGLAKIGTGTLNATAAYDGATSASGGTLNLTLASAAAATPAGAFTASGGTLNLIATNDRTLTATIGLTNGGIVQLSPAAGQTLQVSGAINRYTSTSAPGALTVASGRVFFDGTVTSVADTDWTVSGGILELNTALTDQSDSVVSVAASGTVRLGASDQILTSIASMAGTFDLNGWSETLTSLTATGTVTNASASSPSTLTLTAASTISARLTDTQPGNGTLALVINPVSASTVFAISNAANDYRGGTTMQAGVMTLGGDNVLGSGGLTMLAGTLRSDSASARAYAGTLTLSGAVTLGSTTAGQAGAMTLSGPVLISGSTRTITVSSDVTISGTIGDGGSGYGLSKAGSGLLVLAGTNTYSGLTNITAGTVRAAGGNSTAGNTTLATAVLQLGRDNPLASGTMTLSSGTLASDSASARTLSNTVVFGGNVTLGDATNTGALTLDGSGTGTAMRTLTVVSDVGLSGQLSGALGITKAGSGVLTISNAANGYTGGTTLNAGRIRVGSNSALGGAAGTVTLFSGALSSDGVAARSLANNFSVTGNVTLGDAADTGELTLTGNTLLTGNRTVTFASDVTLTGVLGEQGAGRTLTKDGAGTFTLANAVSYTGGTVINAGRVRLGVASALGTATVTLNGGGLSSDGGTARTVGNPVTYGGNVTLGNASDSGVLNFTGTQTLTGTRTISVASDVVMSSAIVDGGNGQGLTKGGVANLMLTGTSTYTGATTVAAGRLSVDGILGTTPVAVLAAAELGGSGAIGGPVSVLAGGTLAPGNSIASLATGTASFASAGTFGYEVDSALLGSLGTAADLLVVTGDLDIAAGAILSFTDLNLAPAPFVEDTTIFALINYSGTWDGGVFTHNGSPLPDGGRFVVGSQIWQIDYNSPTGGLNYTADYQPSSSFVTVMAVPEPAGVALAAAGIGLVAMLARRRWLPRRDC